MRQRQWKPSLPTDHTIRASGWQIHRQAQSIMLFPQLEILSLLKLIQISPSGYWDACSPSVPTDAPAEEKTRGVAERGKPSRTVSRRRACLTLTTKPMERVARSIGIGGLSELLFGGREAQFAAEFPSDGRCVVGDFTMARSDGVAGRGSAGLDATEEIAGVLRWVGAGPMSWHGFIAVFHDCQRIAIYPCYMYESPAYPIRVRAVGGLLETGNPGRQMDGENAR